MRQFKIIILFSIIIAFAGCSPRSNKEPITSVDKDTTTVVMQKNAAEVTVGALLKDIAAREDITWHINHGGGGSELSVEHEGERYITNVSCVGPFEPSDIPFMTASGRKKYWEDRTDFRSGDFKETAKIKHKLCRSY